MCELFDIKFASILAKISHIVAKNNHNFSFSVFFRLHFLAQPSYIYRPIMKIGVLSDTHLTDIDSCRLLAKKLLTGPFRDVEMILHAGDVVTAELQSCFFPLQWYSVRGNMDYSLTDIPISRIIQLKSARIALMHGWGGHTDLEQRVIDSFTGQKLDVLIYGHSHSPICHLVGSMLVMNPGSATDRRKAPHHTVGVLTLGDGVSGEILIVDP